MKKTKEQISFNMSRVKKKIRLLKWLYEKNFGRGEFDTGKM